MKKSPYFLCVFAFLFAIGFASSASAAGYSCPTYVKYTSCNNGYYMSGGTGAGNSCLTCASAGLVTKASLGGNACGTGDINACCQAACTECSSIPGHTLGGCLTDTNYCYYNETLYGNQVTPGCSVDSCTYGSCAVGSCSRKNYYGATDESCTPGDCTQPYTSFTVRPGTYWNGSSHSYCNGNSVYCPGETKTASGIGTTAWGRYDVGNGYYSTGGDANSRTGRTACTNTPAGGNYTGLSYTGHGDGANACPWSATLNAGYYWTGSTVAQCTAGHYCPGGGTFTGSSGETGRTNCSTATGGRYTNSGAGSTVVTACYTTRTAACTKNATATPTGCASHTFNTCSCAGSTYVQYSNSAGNGDGATSGTTSESCNNTIATVTASANYYVSGTTCQACTSASTTYPRSDGGNIGSSACYTTCAPGTYLSGSSCLPCTGGNYCDGSRAYYNVTGSNGMNICPVGYDAGGAGLSLENQCRMICTGGTLGTRGSYAPVATSVTYNNPCTYTTSCADGYHSTGTATSPDCGPDIATLQFNAPDSTNGSVPGNVACTYKGNCTIPGGNTLEKTPSGDVYVFTQWCTGQNGAGTCFSPNDDANALASGKHGQSIQLYAKWNQTVMRCAAGAYYNGASCVSCTSRNYCPGLDAAVGGGVQGLNACADLGTGPQLGIWANSPVGSDVESDCYAACSGYLLPHGAATPTNATENYANVCTYSATCEDGYSPDAAKQGTTAPECVANTFTIYLNGNGYANNPTGGAMAAKTCTYGQPCDLPLNTFTKTNYHFVGWSENSGNMPGSSFDPNVGDASDLNMILNGGSVRDYLFSGSATLYAIWEIDTKTCLGGNYLNIDRCEICPQDSYCMGVTRQIDGNIHGLSSCADLGDGRWSATSSTGAASSAECYTTCQAAGTAITNGFISPQNPTESNPDVCLYTASCNTGYQAVDNLTEDPKCEPSMFDISFDGNNASSGAMADKSCTVGQSCWLPVNAFARTGFMFTRWAVGSQFSTDYFGNGVNILGLTPFLDVDVTMYAMWEDCDGGYAWNGATCSICPIGKWNASGTTAGGAATSCANCGPGMTTDYMGVSDEADCKLCPVGSYCGATGGEAIACDAEWPETIAGAQTESDCFKRCPDYAVTYGTAKARNSAENYPADCDYYCVSDSGNIGEVRNGVCVETQCANTMELINGACQACDRDHALSYKANGNCEIENCATGYHPEGQQCGENVVACDAPNAIESTMTWNFTLKAFGACIIKTCESGYHLSANACVLDEQPCTIENGIGYKEWNLSKNKWGDCIASSCNPGYTSDPSETNEHTKLCGECKNKYSVLGQQAVSSYVRECEIASCMYQGELYNLDNNECMPICDISGYEDETGSMRWNSSTKKCDRQCKDGYSMW